MPRLRRLEFTYAGDVRVDDENIPFAQIINRFTSLFWIERQCFLEVGITYRSPYILFHPFVQVHSNCLFFIKRFLGFRNISLDIYKHPEIAAICDDNIDGCSNQLIQLRIERMNSSERRQLLLDKIKSSFVGTQFTRLNINCEHISVGVFLPIIHLLPSLNSPKVSSCLSIPSDSLFGDEEGIRFLTSINNKITTVNLEKTIDPERVDFLVNLCLRIQYLQMDVPKDMDLQMILRIILSRTTTTIGHLKAICLTFPDTNNEIVYRLHTLIQSEKLLSNKYMIKCLGNHILLKWN